MNLTEQLDQVVQQQVRQPQQVQQVPAPQRQSFEIGDDDFLTGRQAKQILEQIQHRGPDPMAQRALQSAAETALGFVQQKQENRDVFERYGPEIRALVVQMPPESRTLDNLQVAVDLVQGRHWRDLVASEAQRVVTENPTMRSTGGAGSGSQIPNTHRDLGVLENPAIPEDQRVRLKSMGLTDTQIREFCQANEMTPDQFVKLYAPIKGERAIQVDPATTKLRTV